MIAYRKYLVILVLTGLVGACGPSGDDPNVGSRTPVSSNNSNSGSLGSSNGENNSLGTDNTGQSSSNGGQSSSSGNSNPTLASLELEAFQLVNNYRATQGLSALSWNENISVVCREHSQNMADGNVSFGHGGFDNRADELQNSVGWSGIAENVAYNNFSNPADKAVTGWIGSPGHEENMTGSYTKAGMGVALTADGKYYFTQIFIR